ncbi:MAG: sodium:calcium antiporter [Candidatus Bathyarchaeota archaeon]|nr:sodium:calcium antiporter [Candidatus Bathyarchaeum tardum]WGM89377.1 MAG: sodium:calcium antiporter [Candidatus Bathyarchaeum tardum]WNZ28348.1 MAG: sodium:calcium antiporter [Candidatus Bathyarchaeota archaeon]
MITLVLSIAALAASLIILYWGSKRIVRGASGLSSCLNISRVVVGTVFVAFVTALPELLSSVFAVGLGSSHMALGNIIGSNIYNIPLIIGICGLVGGGLQIKNASINKECMFMLGLSVMLVTLLAVMQQVTWWMGAIFITFYPIFIYHSIKNGTCTVEENCSEHKPNKKNIGTDILLGATALVISTFILVNSAITISTIFGLDQFYVGLTVLALGCVVPEVAVSVAAALAGEEEITIGNVIGDNMLTLTLVFGTVGLTSQFTVSLAEILYTAPFMIIATLMLFTMNKLGHNVNKTWSVVMLATAGIAFVFQTSIPI